MRALEIQTAIYEQLTGWPGMPSVYDDVPQNSDYPYVVIGDDTLTAWDDDMHTGTEATVTIHTWSRAAGRSEAKEIQAMIYEALHRQLFHIDGVVPVECVIEYEETFLDPDGMTRHGVQRFRLIMEHT